MFFSEGFKEHQTRCHGNPVRQAANSKANQIVRTHLFLAVVTIGGGTTCEEPPRAAQHAGEHGDAVVRGRLGGAGKRRR